MKFSKTQLMFFVLTICLSGPNVFAEEQTSKVSQVSLCSLTTGKKLRLNESKYVQIGGIKQWVAIRGKHCSNPVVVVVHGGPGNPLSLYHDSMFKQWENEFTIVHWDQRGSGRTYEENQKIGELNIEDLAGIELTADLLVSDGLEVTQYIRKRLDVEKVIISGTSWGSFLAMKMVVAEPENYSFYVGSSLLVNYKTNTLESYKLLLSHAFDKKDQAAIDALKNLGLPPWSELRSFGEFRRIIGHYEEQAVTSLTREVGEGYLSEKTRAAYFTGEEFSFVKFLGLRGDGMAQNIALDDCCIEYKIPVYLLQGQQDLLSIPDVTKAFYDKIIAPSKEYILVPKVGHQLNTSLLDKTLETLKLGMTRLK